MNLTVFEREMGVKVVRTDICDENAIDAANFCISQESHHRHETNTFAWSNIPPINLWVFDMMI